MSSWYFLLRVWVFQLFDSLSIPCYYNNVYDTAICNVNQKLRLFKAGREMYTT